MNNKQPTAKYNDLIQVQEHYQDYPYPFRDPEDEAKRLLVLTGEYLGELNHHLYQGKQNFADNFRVLIAGGGTGDSVVFMAEQLRNTNAEIVYLDFSKPSMEIAQKRAQKRGLNNITWLNDSILNIPKLNLGKFDFINCSGVLHHLENPDLGLKILADSLTAQGGMHLMIYAKYGRTGVYHVQEVMKIINKDVSNRAQEIMNGKLIVGSLPATNWFMRAQELINDHVSFGDIGLYDLFLHKQDRAYSVPEMYEFAHKAGLNFVDYSVPIDRITLKIENYIKDFSLLQKIKKMDIVTQQAICELLTGNIIKHSFFVSNRKDTVASTENFANVPYFYGANDIPTQIVNIIETNNIAFGQAVTFTFNNAMIHNVSITLQISALTKHLFKHLSQGDKSLDEILSDICVDLGTDISRPAFLTEINTNFAPFFSCGVLLLKDKSVKLP